MAKLKGNEDGKETWTKFYEEVAFWYRGGRDRWPEGREVALVLGKVMGYFNIQKTSCRASIPRMACELSMSPDTVGRCIKVLREDGLIRPLSGRIWHGIVEYVVDPERVRTVISAVRQMRKAAKLEYIGQRAGKPAWEIWPENVRPQA